MKEIKVKQKPIIFTLAFKFSNYFPRGYKRFAILVSSIKRKILKENMTVNVWRNFIIKPRLDSFIAPIAEVGYSHYGPTFAIAGTLTARNTVALIYNICTEITNANKKSAHFMDWFAFRSAQHTMGNFSELELTMTSKFTITPKKIHKYNILFIDNGRFSEMKPLLQAIKTAWAEYLVTAAKDNQPIHPGKLFSEFQQLRLVADATARLKTITYWEPGHYQAKIRITAENPKQLFDITKYFFLTPEDTETLLNNTPKIIANICQQPQTLYACATPHLTDIK